MPQFEYQIGPLTGRASTKTAARQAAEDVAARCAKAAQEGAWVYPAPVFPSNAFENPNDRWVAIGVAPDEHGDWYTFLVRAGGMRTITACIEKRSDAIEAVARHAAALTLNARTTEEDLDKLGVWFAGALRSDELAAKERREWQDIVYRSRVFIDAVKAGKSETEAHRLMCEVECPR